MRYIMLITYCGGKEMRSFSTVDNAYEFLEMLVRRGYLEEYYLKHSDVDKQFFEECGKYAAKHTGTSMIYGDVEVTILSLDYFSSWEDKEL